MVHTNHDTSFACPRAKPPSRTRTFVREYHDTTIPIPPQSKTNTTIWRCHPNLLHLADAGLFVALLISTFARFKLVSTYGFFMLLAFVALSSPNTRIIRSKRFNAVAKSSSKF